MATITISSRNLSRIFVRHLSGRAREQWLLPIRHALEGIQAITAAPKFWLPFCSHAISGVMPDTDRSRSVTFRDGVSGSP
jgi:hypothetical protein